MELQRSPSSPRLEGATTRSWLLPALVFFATFGFLWTAFAPDRNPILVIVKVDRMREKLALMPQAKVRADYHGPGGDYITGFDIKDARQIRVKRDIVPAEEEPRDYSPRRQSGKTVWEVVRGI